MNWYIKFTKYICYNEIFNFEKTYQFNSDYQRLSNHEKVFFVTGGIVVLGINLDRQVYLNKKKIRPSGEQLLLYVVINFQPLNRSQPI